MDHTVYVYTSYKYDYGHNTFSVNDNIVQDIRLSGVEYVKYRCGLTYSEIMVNNQVHQVIQIYFNSGMNIGLRNFLHKTMNTYPHKRKKGHNKLTNGV